MTQSIVITGVYGLDVVSQRVDRLNGRITSLETKLEHYQAIEKEI
ncbi:hypothetical protein [Lysinibacillus xylanilyticus]